MFEHRLLVHATGRELYLSWLFADWTYQHVYEGPCDEFSHRGLVEDARRLARRIEASKLSGSRDPTPQHIASYAPYILPLAAMRRSTAVGAGDVALPAVRCLATLESSTAIHPGDLYSSVIVVWFQDEMPFPIAPEAIEAMRTLDWAEHAYDWSP